MTAETHCEVCLRPTSGHPCRQHPHAELLDAHSDGSWLKILRGQRQRQRLKLLAAVMLPILVLCSFLVGPIGLLVGVSAHLLMIFADLLMNRTSPEDLAVLSTPVMPVSASHREGNQSPQHRRSRRIERANERARSSAGRVTMAG